MATQFSKLLFCLFIFSCSTSLDKNIDRKNPSDINTNKNKIVQNDTLLENDEFGITNSPSVEIRFTDTSNKKTIFYFDLIRFKGENVTGRQSRFMSAFKKTITKV